MIAKYQAMNLDELRRYVLTHREDMTAFHVYVDRSKSEGRMNSLDLSDPKWEEKIAEAVKYSSKAVRWYCSSNEDSSTASTIIQWWKGLDKKDVIKHHITGIKVDRETGIWEPTQVNPPIKVSIKQPDIEIGELTAFVKYADQNGLFYQIETTAIDLDLIKQKLYVWSIHGTEVFIFAPETHT